MTDQIPLLDTELRAECWRCQSADIADCRCADLFAESDRIEAAGLMPWQTRRKDKP